MKFVIWAKRLFLTLSLLGLIATNMLTLTNTAFNALLSGMMSTAFGLQTVSGVFQGKINAQKAKLATHRKAAKRFGGKLTVRTKKLVATTIAELPAEAIPILGITVLIGATAYEIKLACDNLDDLNELYGELELEVVDSGIMNSVCHPPLPSVEDLKESVDDYLS